MKIQKVQALPFNGKERFMPSPQMEVIRELLTNMNNECTKKHLESGHDILGITTALEYSSNNDSASFTDGRFLSAKVNNEKQMEHGETTIVAGKTKLVINNNTGKISNYKKPLLASWTRTLKKVSDYLEIFKKNYNNPKIIEKVRLNIGYFSRNFLK